MKYILSLLTVCILFSAVQADLPVHCTEAQIIGKWNVELSKVYTTKSSEMVACGHSQPDNEDSSWKAMKDSFEKESDMTVTLNQDKTTNGKNTNGSWTMIYDEGFEYSVGDYKFFSFSKYQSTGFDFESVCDQTLTGWYNNISTGEKGCIRAYKDGGSGQATKNVKQDKVVQPKNEKKPVEQKEENQDQQLQVEEQQNFIATSRITSEPLDLGFTTDRYDSGLIFAQTSSKTNLRKNGKEDSLNLHKGFNDHQKVVDRLNMVQKSWTAKVPEEFEELTLEEMNSRAGRIRHKQKTNPWPQEFEFVQTKGGDFKHYSRESVSDLPSEFTWEEYLREPVSQKDCGSCYAIATSEMLSTRLKIHHEEDVKISAQHSLDCNYYNQGCDGGYGFLMSKFFSEYEMVSEECHPYKARNGRCSDSCDVSKEKKTYKVTNYMYIGGAYGKSTERNMMEEMMENGPIVVSFEPAYDFMYYGGGIYHSVDIQDWLKNHEKQPAWEKVDHSVLAYGWGEEDGEKYWKVLNSWGGNWGESGHFRIRRGTDESHIESMGESAMPIVLNKN